MLDEAVQDLPYDLAPELPTGWERAWGTPVRQTLAILVALAGVLPLLWMISTSVRPAGMAPAAQFEWIPPVITLQNYIDVFRLFELGRFLGNSVFIILIAVPVTLVTASLAGFAISGLPQRWRTPLIALSVCALMVPVMALWLPRFMIYKAVGILDTPLALMAPAIMGTSPLYVLLFTWAFVRLPREIFEQARVDGASAWRVWWSIGLPLTRPTSAVVGLLATVFYWSDFISPQLYITNPAFYTLPQGIELVHQVNRTGWPLMMTGAVILTVPVVLLFFAAQRFLFGLARR